MSNSKYFNRVSGALALFKYQSLALSVLVMFVFPIIEGWLVNVATASTDTGSNTALITLIIIGILHLILGILALLRDKSIPASAVSDSLVLEAALAERDAELDRRKQAYLMLCNTFQALNSETCALSDENPMCDTSFENGMRILLQSTVEDIGILLGVIGNRFTLEIYLENYQIPIGGKDKDPSGRTLEYFHGTHVDRDSPLGLNECDIASSAFKQNGANHQSISENRGLYYVNNARKQSVYFNRFAFCPIVAACDETETIGVFILTSEQDKPFAPDVLEVMWMLSQIIARYLFSYRECIFHRYKAWDRPYVLVNRMLLKLKAPKSISMDEGIEFILQPDDALKEFVYPNEPNSTLGQALLSIALAPQGESLIELLSKTKLTNADKARLRPYFSKLANARPADTESAPVSGETRNPDWALTPERRSSPPFDQTRVCDFGSPFAARSREGRREARRSSDPRRQDYDDVRLMPEHRTCPTQSELQMQQGITDSH